MDKLAMLFGFEEDYKLTEAYFNDFIHPVLTIKIEENENIYTMNYFDDDALQKLKILEKYNFSVKNR